MQTQGIKQWSSRPLSQDEHEDSHRENDLNHDNNDYGNPDEQQRPAGLAPSREMLSDQASLPQSLPLSGRGVETIAGTNNDGRVQSGENILRQSFFTHMHDQLSGEKMCPD